MASKIMFSEQRLFNTRTSHPLSATLTMPGEYDWAVIAPRNKGSRKSRGGRPGGNGNARGADVNGAPGAASYLDKAADGRAGGAGGVGRDDSGDGGRASAGCVTQPGR